MENKLFGEYLGYTKRKFTKKDLLDIRQSIIDGILIKDLAVHYNVGEKAIRSIFKEFIITMDSIKLVKTKSRLGSKKESYYETEEEMLIGVPQYTWKDLDIHEKKFYLNYGRKFRSKRSDRKD